MLVACIAFLIASIPGPDYLIERQVGYFVWIMIGIMAAINRASQKYGNKGLDKIIIKKRLSDQEAKSLQKYVAKEWESMV